MNHPETWASAADQAPSTPVVSVVLPCLNEALTLEACIRKVRRALDDGGYAAEIVVADNGSTDGSQQLAAALGARVLDVRERGYGAAVLAGLRASRGRFIIQADADDSYDLAGILPFLGRLQNGDDLVIGNRFSGSIEKGAMPFLNRYLGNPVLSLVGRLLFPQEARDFHCGLRAMRRDAILGIGLRCPGMEFATEMIARAQMAGLRISEIPTVLGKDGRNRPPHLRPWRDGLRHLALMLRLRWSPARVTARQPTGSVN